jgi:CheY-like chemotaxis protein
MATPDPNSPGSAAPSRGALILVVERNPVVQRLERYFLEQAGFDVEFATDGLNALARSRELRPRILVTEILVPKLDGLSLCRAIKSTPETKDILVMIFSHLQAEDRATEAGADAFLTKPIDEELLVETVGKLLASQKQSVGMDLDG